MFAWAWLACSAVDETPSAKVPPPPTVEVSAPPEPPGRALFTRTWSRDDPLSVAGDGLGPNFNDVSCAACHALAGPGGAGGNAKNVVLGISRSGVEVVHRVQPIRSPTADRIVARVERAVPALFGVGLIDAIPDSALLAAERDGTGRVGRDATGAPTRFGWKGHIATLDAFVDAACANELGLQTPTLVQPGIEGPGVDVDHPMLSDLTAFTASLPRPGRQATPGADEGEALFDKIGCAACHRPDFGGVMGLYSDLLLHDMGQGLADRAAGYGPTLSRVDPEGVRRTEWRTPPLWGLRDSAPYLHDGSALTLEKAIGRHGGEAQPAADYFSQLSGVHRREVLAFLNSLVAPAYADPAR